MRIKVRTATTRRLGFRSIAWILAFAFSLQSLIAQAHIHWAPDGNAGAAIVKTLPKKLSPDKWPSQNENSNCPFCQAVAHAGTFITPAKLGSFLPLSWEHLVAIPLAASAIYPFYSLPWHSRAPPQR